MLSFSSFSFNNLCINDMTTYNTLVGALGKDFSIAILFLVVHNAQAKPAKKEMINLLGRPLAL